MPNCAELISALKRNKVSLMHYVGCCFVALSCDNCCCLKTDFSWFVLNSKKLRKKEKRDVSQNDATLIKILPELHCKCQQNRSGDLSLPVDPLQRKAYL